jgi:thiol:disulfide interchange protein DsbD
MLRNTPLALFAALILYAFYMPAIAAWGSSQPELLPPEQAFRLLAEVKGNKIRLEYSIAPGYYLYRKKFSFNTPTAGYLLGKPQFPKGEIVHDEYFGDVETYRGPLVIELPYQRQAGAAKSFELNANSQGCADIGVCYQPYTQTVPLQAQTSAP